MKLVIALLLLFIFAPVTAAQQAQQNSQNPGIGPGSPFYGLEVAWDNFRMSLGLAEASDIADERALEARRAAENGKWSNARKAADKAASIASRSGINGSATAQAERTLENVLSQAPDEARQGISNALKNLRKSRGKPASIPNDNITSENETPRGSAVGPPNRDSSAVQGSEDEQRPYGESAIGTENRTEDQVTSSDRPVKQTSDSQGQTSTGVTVTYTDRGFEPSSVTVNTGETVRFVDKTGKGVWIGSNDHPFHTKYDGTSTSEHCEGNRRVGNPFDSCSAVSSFSFTFNQTGEFGYHDHLNPGNEGQVVVR